MLDLLVSSLLIGYSYSYVPYKYALEKFNIVRNTNKDHADPSSLALLTARSKVPGTPLVDICVIGPHWDVMDGYGPPVRFLNCSIT